MIKFFKKTISAFLATVMCIPTSVLTFANATESESVNGEYTISLTDTENGIMQFSESTISSTEATQEGYQMVQVDENGELKPIDNDGSIWAFYPGDEIEIELIPDEGYSVSSFTVKKASNGNVMSHMETDDNVFSFTMPDISLSIEATFVYDFDIADEINWDEIDIENILPDGYIWGKDSPRIDTGLTATLVNPFGISMYSTAGSDVTITPGTSHAYGSWSTHEFNVTTSDGTFLGYCAQPNYGTPSGTFMVSELDNDLIKAALICAPGGVPEMYELAGKNIYDENDHNVYAYAHALIGYLYMGSLTGLSSSMSHGIQNMAGMLTYLVTDPAAGELYTKFQTYLSSCKAYIAYTTDLQQDIVWLEFDGSTPPPSTPPVDPFDLYLYKMSSIPGAELNGATLGGAKFEVIRYADVKYTTIQECINNIENAETLVWYYQTKEEDEWAALFDGVDYTGYIYFAEDSYIAPDSPTKTADEFGGTGTYWIREIKASDGFLNEGVMMDVDSSGNVNAVANDISNLGLIYYLDGETKEVICNGTTTQISTDTSIEIGALPEEAIVLMEKPDVPQIQTYAYVNDTGTQYADATSDDIYCVDHVSVTNLRDQTKYTLETYLIDLTDGNRKVGESIITEIDTSKIGSTSSSSTKSWEKDITIKVDAVDEGLANHTLMFVNELTDTEDGKVFEHNDTDFVEEYIYFPDSGTLATDRETGLHITYTGHNVSLVDDPINISQGTVRATVVDQIWYKNLQPGRKYEIKAWMVDVDTASAADDGNGSPIVISEDTKYFNAEAADGSVNVTFTFDVNQSIAGRKYVIFSEIYLNDELVAAHREIDDENETIWLPKVATLLTDEQTGIDITYAKGTVKMNDAVEYTRMKPGYQYQIRGTLYNMATGEVLLDDNGNEVRVTKDVTTSTENGTWEISYEFPADTLPGTIVVSYVEVYVLGADGDWHIVSEHKDFWDKNERIYMPYIDTTALDQKTNHHISYAEKTMNIYDTVHYEALRPEYTYTLVSELRDVATGQIVVDDSGKKQVLTTTFKADFDLQDNQFLTYGDVIPQNHDGSGITFSIDAEYFAGRTLVIYERLYVEGADKRLHLIADHQVLLDEKQTIHVPKVWTRALDMDTFTHTSFADGSSTLIDTFSYDNLIPGLTYELVGYVVDKNQTIKAGTQITATGTDGKLATNRKRFTPSTSSGSERLAFEINTSKFGTEDYNGMTFVIYEELYVVDRYDDADHLCIVARHTDIADVNQTIYVPRITTNLNDNRTGTKIMLAEKDAHLVDTVNYYRFQPNTQYTIKGRLINMETGYTLTDSKDMPVEVTKEVWTNDTGTGSWDIDYTFDATDLAGTMVVAYADVYVQNGEREDILSHVATHNDFWDGSQRVYIPIISTVATDQKTNSHITYAENNVWVTDRIYYSFLKPDTEYKLISKLVDKDTGEVVIDDKGLSQVIESTFTTTPNESQEKYNQIISNPMTDSSDTGIGYSYGYVIPADGTILPDGSKYHGVVFTFDAHTFEGRTLVIYEELQIKTTEGYKTIATHMDINDENQTVHIPKIRTNAVDSETLTHTSKMDGSMTIIDTVTYENLIPGFTYVLEGYLMDKPRSDSKADNGLKI